MDIFRLFIAAWIPVLKMLIVTAVGSLLAADFIGLLSEEARKHMNNVVFYVFYPALAASNLAQTFTLERFASTWFMPINISLTYIIGSAFGWILNKIIKPPSHLRPLILGCCASGNLGIMLLIVIPGTCNEKGSPFGTPEVCHEQALAYASLSMGISDLVFWSYVYNIVRLSLGVTMPKIKAIDHEASAPKSIEGGTGSVHHQSEDSFSIIGEERCESFQITSIEAPTKSKGKNLGEMAKSLYQKPAMITIRRLFTPSTYGVIVGILVGAISPLKKALVGENAPLRAIQGAIRLLGDGAIPLITLIMGGNLVKGFRKSDTKVSFIIGVVLVRYLFLPLLGVAIVRGAVHFGILHQDPLYQFVLLVQYALPPAMSMGVITQQFGGGESECSIIFFWAYALSLVLFPLWSAFFMWLVS